MKTGIYQYNEINGWIATCRFAVVDCGDYCLVQRFCRGASDQIINVGTQYTLRELPSQWVKVA